MTKQTSGKSKDWVDPFIRSLVGWKADREERLLVRLLESKKRQVPISELSRGEVKLLPKLRKPGYIEITAGRYAKLTKLGATIARGTKKMYPEFWR